MGLFDRHENKEQKGNRLQQAFEMAKPALSLSPEQEQQITKVFERFKEERQSIKSEGGDDAKDRIRSSRQQAKEEIFSVLNDEQRKIFEEHLSKLKEQ